MGYTIYSIVGTILEQVALVIIVRVGLPYLFNIHVPWWGLAILMAAFLVYSLFTYRMGKRALGKQPLVSPEAIIGSEGIVATSLHPKGYVKVKGELWRASSKSETEVGDEIEVIGIEGIELIVAPKEKSFFERYKERNNQHES